MNLFLFLLFCWMRQREKNINWLFALIIVSVFDLNQIVRRNVVEFSCECV